MTFFSKHDPGWHRLRLVGASHSCSADLRLLRFSCPLADPALAGRSLAFFSDLHWRGKEGDRVAALVETINGLSPDWIVFGGDLMRNLADLPGALAHLAGLRAARGKIAIRGNRESVHFWKGVDFWRDAYAEIGFVLLVNQLLGPQETGGLCFAGLDDPRHGNPDLDVLSRARAERAPLVVTLVHTPDVVGNQGERFLGQLVLAGHTHGGQIRIPGLGPIYTSSIYGSQFDRGWFERTDGTLMYVTAGAGETGHNLLRRRLFCPAELVLLEFVPVQRR